jgi:hypothetical protein
LSWRTGGTEHLGRGLLAASFEFGQVLHGHAGTLGDLGKGALLPTTFVTKHGSRHVPPERVGSRDK